MTTGLTTAAMLAVMLLHAVFGCCWHHSHETCAPLAVEESASAAEEQSRTDGDRCPCGHHHEDSQTPDGDDEPAGGHDGHDCCGEVCRFVTSSEAWIPIDSGMPLDQVVAGDTASGQMALLTASRLSRSDGPPGDPSPTKRLLTRLCVWRL